MNTLERQIIYITGPDGSGKTSFIKEIEGNLASGGAQVVHVWIRSPKILSKPLMLLARTLGLTQYKTIEGIRFGRHDFHKSRFVRSLYPFLQLIDFKLVWWFKKMKLSKESIIVFDRFSLDTLCDLMVSTRNFNLHRSWVGKGFIKMVPELRQVVLLSVKENTIRDRKSDTRYDELLEHKIKAFSILAQDLGLKRIDNNGGFLETKSALLEYFAHG